MPEKFETISHLKKKLLSSSVKKVGDCFKCLWPFQNIQTLLNPLRQLAIFDPPPPLRRHSLWTAPYGAPLLEERLICLKSVKISYLAKEKSSSSLTAACRGSRQHFWQNDKIVAIRTMGFVILFPTLL